MRKIKKGQNIPWGICVRECNDFPNDEIIIKIPLFPVYRKKDYDVIYDNFKKGWVLIGAFFSLRFALGSQGIGKREVVS